MNTSGVKTGTDRATSAVRYRSTHRWILAVGGLALLWAALTNPVPGWFNTVEAQSLPGEDPPPTLNGPVVDVRIEGNTTIPPEAIFKYVKTRAGQNLPADRLQAQVREDVRALYGTRWFFWVEPRYRPVEDGLVVIFRVQERPVVQNVEYRGNKKIKTKHLAAQTGLKKGSPFDVSANRESARRIEQYYHEKGYTFAKVKLVKGGHKDDREVIFEIDEGPKVRVPWVGFTGNKAVSDGVLRLKLRTSRAILGVVGGLYDPSTIADDIASLREYYHSLGYFDVQIDHDITFRWGRRYAFLNYTIDEGPRYKIGSIDFSGNRVFSEAELREALQLTEGDYFNLRYLNKDIAHIEERYGKLGRLFASVDARPVFLEEPGVANLQYVINEDKVYRIRRVDAVINGDNPHTKRFVLLNNSLVHPGDLADPKLIERSRRRIEGSGIVERGPQNGVKVDIRPVVRENVAGGHRVFRGQSIETVLRAAGHSHPSSPKSRPNDATAFGRSPKRSVGSGRRRRRQEDSGIRGAQPAAPGADALNIRGQSFDTPGPLVRPGVPPFTDNPQGNPLVDPLYEPLSEEEIDIIFQATEARTGRLMFGVGVNSDAGVVGSIVLTEQNFDILRPPTSFRDFLNGTAWRGGGQRFRLEAVPGNVVSRYLFSWSDPHFLYTDYSLGVSAFFYNRFFPDWDEERAGGRISVGRQFTPFFSLSGAVRLEEIRLTNPDFPTPVLLQQAVGSSLLSTVRVTATHDTRDSAFLPTEGHLLAASYEQAFGDFDYPRFEAEARQYFTVFERPDGSGRHILSLSGEIGWTDEGTPIFERFFAGGFQTFRGFEFRGVGPRQFGVNIGGRWMLLGSIQYMLPLLANETIQAVAFSDFGTIEEDVALENFRVSVGAGLRLTIPAMGPVPLAFDWAIPIIREDFDETRVFTFFVGITR